MRPAPREHQGLVKLIGPGIPESPESRPIEVVRETKLSAVIDGHQQMATLVLVRAVDMGLGKAAAHGFGIVGTNSTCTSTGIGDSGRNWGNLVLAIDPGLLTDRAGFAENVARLARKVKGTKRLPGVGEVFLPGERGNRLAREHLRAGTIEIEERLLGELEKAAGEV